MANGRAAINRCPPGGSAGVRALSKLLDRDELPLDPACGQASPATVAFIDPQACIGCARCLPVCPVDAILGASQLMHTVLELECNGCELCLDACPVDCIAIVPRASDQPAPEAADNRRRFDRHRARLQRIASERERLLADRKRAARPP